MGLATARRRLLLGPSPGLGARDARAAAPHPARAPRGFDLVSPAPRLRRPAARWRPRPDAPLRTDRPHACRALQGAAWHRRALGEPRPARRIGVRRRTRIRRASRVARA